MAPRQQSVDRLVAALRLETPIVALYDAPPSAAFEPLVEAKGRACCFAYYGRWGKGETLVVRRADDDFERASHGCPGLQRAMGLAAGYPTWMANFLTDGKNGAPTGEGLKASAELAQRYLDGARAPAPSGDTVLIGPLRVREWDSVRTVTFFADPDRLAALLTLASYWSAEQDEIATPFSSGCGLMWRELAGQPKDRAILGCTDIAMRKYLPPEIMCVSVSASRFEQMVGFPDESFLDREWWKELLASRERSTRKASR